MRFKQLFILACLTAMAWTAQAHTPTLGRKVSTGPKVESRAFCANSISEIDQEINNVRARLLGGGDCWWNLKDGRYIVPKVDVASGQTEVSSIFAASVWLGGYAPGNNLKLACQDYRSDGKNDFWPGPLDPNTGRGDVGTCKNWDRHFRVTGVEIRQHLANVAAGVIDAAAIPKGVKGWPARGNAYFEDVWGFPLPFTTQALAGFFDKDGDGNYEPLEGDYPSIEIRGCALDRYPDEMIFWIYNDDGGFQPHARTGGEEIQMEVQVQAFSYATTDALNDMTFQRYKLINRASDYIDSCFFAIWVDPDLGCFRDDYIGCDTALELMYVYNQDPQDGDPGVTCPDGNGAQVPTYQNDVPILGVDYFRGPLEPVPNPNQPGEDTLVEIGMSSFVYYNNPQVGNPNPATVDPSAPNEYYNYLTGSWRDGTPYTYGGSGYGGTIPIEYAFTESPNDPTGWSMCTANLTFGDRRTLQASGPFRLNPGAVNELIIGVPWVADIVYDCPDVEQLFRADKLAQGLFDNCFERLEGPDAPTVDWIENNQQVVAVLTNEVSTSNNVGEKYQQLDFLAPDDIKNSTDPAVKATAFYRFEGYNIYQLQNPNVSVADFDNTDKSRLVYQVDKRNGTAKVYDWLEEKDPSDPTKFVYYPVERVDGEDAGIRHSFSITEDKFSRTNDKRLINHKKYYYAVIAYAYNEYERFNPLVRPITGQQRSYLPGSRGADGRQIEIYTVIPRPVVDLVLNSAYGEGIEITREEGQGAGGNFLDLTEETTNRILSTSFDSTLTYRGGRGPINVTIFNPFEVKDGEYEIELIDGDLTDTKLDDTTRWVLRSLKDNKIIKSDRTIAELNEQIIADYGFSVTIAQTPETGNFTPEKDPSLKLLPPGDKNGALGATITYAKEGTPWLLGFPDAGAGSSFNFVKTTGLERDAEFDPNEGLSTMGDGWFVPYVLMDWDLPAGVPTSPDSRMVTAAWTGKIGPNYLNKVAVGGNDYTNPDSRYRKLNALPNVDIVFTSDKSKWSRCVVIESANEYYTGALNGVTKDPTLVTESPDGKPRRSFDTRYALSVGKDDANSDGLPDVDGAVEPATLPDGAANPRAGQAIRGMGWFPGYAINVETGERLNVFFGENSCYDKALDPAFTGRDMLWNPTGQIQRGVSNAEINEFVFGGQHWVYVHNSRYDECERLRIDFTPDFYTATTALTKKQNLIKKLAWAGMLQAVPGTALKPLKDGLIPIDVTVKLRVDNPYQTWWSDATGKLNGHPKYRFKLQGSERSELTVEQTVSVLDSIKVVPNPYYGFSEYETSSFSNVVKITNLPGVCTVTIYSLDGRFIRQYKRNEQYEPYQQIVPDLEWDLKNSKGVPVASGVYLIHVSAAEKGERTIKWFGVQRQFDPSGL